MAIIDEIRDITNRAVERITNEAQENAKNEFDSILDHKIRPAAKKGLYKIDIEYNDFESFTHLQAVADYAKAQNFSARLWVKDENLLPRRTSLEISWLLL